MNAHFKMHFVKSRAFSDYLASYRIPPSHLPDLETLRDKKVCAHRVCHRG